MATETDDIWGRIERSRELVGPVVAPQTPVQSKAEEAAEKGGISARTWIRVLDVVSSLFWVYILLKIFAFDLDRSLLNAIDPRLVGVLDYRVFFYLGVIAVLLIFFRKKIWVVGYVIFFPLLLLVWKVPAFFIRHKNWGLFLGALQVTFTALSSFRYNFLSKSLALLAVVLILVAHGRGAVLAGAVYLGGLLLWSYVRVLRKTFTAPAFLVVQRRQISRLLNSKVVRGLTEIDDDLRVATIEVYDRGQLTRLATAASNGILINAGLYYWAYQLERYRKEYSPAVVFNLLSYLWLFMGTLLTLAFINEAIVKTYPHQYTYDHYPPSMLAVTVYSMATLFVTNAAGIAPVGNAALALELAANIAGPVFLAASVLNFAVTFRRERDENALQDLVAELKVRAREQGEGFRSEWQVDVHEARRRLEALGEGLGVLWQFLISRIPDEFLQDD